MTAEKRAPQFDSELAAALASAQAAPVTLTAEMVSMIRPMVAGDPAVLIAGRAIEHTERTIPGLPGEPTVTLSFFQRPNRAPGGLAIYFVHAGGLVIGDRFFGLAPVLDWVEHFDATLVTAEYRLAPEHPYPAALNDVYAGLTWTAENAKQLGCDRVLLAGASAGGGLAAAAALRARELDGPELAGQLLIYPMLDDRNESVSNAQYDGFGRWDRGSNDTAWTAYLGNARMTPDLPIYAAPARATNLAGLPPTFIEVGSAELFRDEAVAYATQIWADGGDCELHVWPGGYHGYDLHAPGSRLTAAAIEARRDWIARKFSLLTTAEYEETTV